MEGLEKLEAEALEMDNSSITVIFEYLKTRTDLYDKFNNEEKTLKQMYKFIYEKARKQQKNNVAMISDRLVYLWAIRYFCTSNEELGLNKKEVAPQKASTETKKEIVKEERKKETDNQITLFEEGKK